MMEREAQGLSNAAAVPREVDKDMRCAIGRARIGGARRVDAGVRAVELDAAAMPRVLALQQARAAPCGECSAGCCRSRGVGRRAQVRRVGTLGAGVP
jgi:hypothetical protein